MIPGATVGAVVAKTIADQIVIGPPINMLLMFYTTLGAGGTLKDVETKVRRDYAMVVKNMWCVWIPANLCNFALVPPTLRVPYVSFISLNWSVYVCIINGRAVNNPAPTALPDLTPLAPGVT